MAKLFFSYSRSDLDVVSTLVSDAASLGHHTWIDHELTGGQRWWDEVLRQIRACEIFVTALSPAFEESKACAAEYRYAAALGKPILPVLVKTGVADSLLPPELSQIQRVDYSGADKSSLSALVRGLSTMPDAAPLPDPLPEPPEVPATYLFDLRNEIGTPNPLSSDKQLQLLDQIEGQYEAGHDPVALRTLLRDFSERDDLLVRTANRINDLESRIPAAAQAPGPTSEPAPEQPAPEPAGAVRTEEPLRIPDPGPADTIGQFSMPAAVSDRPRTEEGQVNGAWWIAPILFGILGGTIAWLAVRDTNARTARNLFITGIVASIIWFALA